MGNHGRFGKYGEIKRTNRLRRSRINPPPYGGFSGSPPRRKFSLNESLYEKSPPKIRESDPADIHFIAQLSGKVFSVYGAYEDSIWDWFGSGKTVTLIAELHKKPVGFVMISRSFQEWNLERFTELLAIAVEPKNQGKGIGHMLIKEIERVAEGRDISRLFLHTAKENLTARRLFTKNGYGLLGIKKTFYPKGQDALVMSKEIGGITDKI